MANNLKHPVEISPSVRDTDEDGTPDSDVLTLIFSEDPTLGWISEWFEVEGTEHGSEELSIMAYVDWQGATEIDLLPQFRHREDAVPQDPIGQLREGAALPIPRFDGARVDGSFNVELDTVKLLQANFRVDPGSQELGLNVQGVASVRFLARAVGGAPIMRLQVLSGGGWRGS